MQCKGIYVNVRGLLYPDINFNEVLFDTCGPKILYCKYMIAVYIHHII